MATECNVSEGTDTMTKKDLMEYIEDLDDDCEVQVAVTTPITKPSMVQIESIMLPSARDECGLIAFNI